MLPPAWIHARTLFFEYFPVTKQLRDSQYYGALELYARMQRRAGKGMSINIW